MNRLLVDAVATALMGIEHASDDMIDPDWAVKLLEGIGGPLQRFTAVERADFTAVLAELEEELGADPIHRRRSAFYQNLPFMIWGD